MSDDSVVPFSPFLPVKEKAAVFINCPFDAEFAPLFEALVFTLTACGFKPRSALESADISVPRMERITRAIFTSKYSIHDLSRCRGEGDERLARFNMPLELGIALARRHITPHEHDWLVLAPEGHLYNKFISDLAGFDLLKYDGSEQSLVQRIIFWLVMRPGAPAVPTPQSVLNALPQFRVELAALKIQWGPKLPWTLLIEAAEKTALNSLATIP